MASGHMSSDDISLLRSRVSPASELPNDAIHLFYRNEDTDIFNTAKLNSILTTQYISTALDSIKASHLSTEVKNRHLEAVKSFKTSKTQGLSTSLILKSTAKYMVTVNIDTADGLVNGASGILMDIGFNTSNSPQILWIKFLDDSVGLNARAKCPHPLERSWTPIFKTIKSFQFHSNQQVSIDRNQFPVVPAEGITIHKSQGATYTKVVVHTTSRMSREALYVACSRATNAAGLFIVGGFVPPKSDAQSPVEQELRILRSEKLLNSHYDCLFKDNWFTALFHNTESLHCHFSDICSDQLMLRASLLCFVEASIFSNEIFEIPGFTQVVRLDCESVANRTRPKRGILIFIKNELFENVSLFFTGRFYSDPHNLNSAVFEYVVLKYKCTGFLIIYKTPAYPLPKFEAEFENLLLRFPFFR
jgi:hypothetical protein